MTQNVSAERTSRPRHEQPSAAAVDDRAGAGS